MKIPPTETKSVHVKTYVEPTVSNYISAYQVRHNLESTSAATRALILAGISAEEQAQSIVK